MTTTNFTRLTTEQKTVWMRDLWKNARNQAFLTRFLGEGPNAMVTHVTSLTKNEKGTRAVMTLVPDLEGDGVAGDRRLKDNEEEIKAFDQVIRVDQLRNANKSEGRIADQKSIVKFRETSRNLLAYWLGDRCDQMAFLALSGVAFSNKNAGGTRTGSDLINLEFAADVSAPTSGRVLNWDGSNGALTTSGVTSAVTAADLPSYEMLVQTKAYAKNNYVPGIMEKGEETYHVFFSPLAMAKLKLDPDYKEAMKHAQTRGDGNPLFTGSTVKLDGLYLHEFRHVYNTSGTATKWGSGNTVDGCQVLFCGRQALGFADIGLPYWDEEGDDYGNQRGIATGKIFGFKKPVWQSAYGLTAGTNQDFSVISIYVAQ